MKRTSKPRKAPKMVPNFAYPLIEAKARVEEGLFPWQEWDGEYLGYGFRREVEADDIEAIVAIFEDEEINHDESLADVVFEAAERSAFLLGLEWDNDEQGFVPISGKGQYRQDPETGEWEAL